MVRWTIALIDKYGALVLAGWLMLTAYRIMTAWHADMAGLYVAAHAFANGHPELMYPTPDRQVGTTPEAWLPLLASFGYSDAVTYPYVYPPIWAALLAPLTIVMPIQAFLPFTALLQAGLFFASVRIVHHLVGSFMPWPRWALISTPILATSTASVAALSLNQPQITLTFFALLATLLLIRGSSIRAGILFALPAAIKLSPIVFVVVLLATRKWRAGTAMIGTVLALVLLDLVIGGGRLNHDFITKISTLADYTVSSRLSINIGPILHGWFVGGENAFETIPAGGYTALTPAWLTVVSIAALLVTTCWLVIVTGAQDSATRVVSLSFGLMLIIALFGQFGWAHYYLGPLMALPMLLDPRLPRSALVVFAAALVVCSVSFMLRAPLELTQALPFLTYASFLALIACRPTARRAHPQ